jgi:protein-S-isoprenylcysteine O-methyltransferase Ste14
MWIKILVMLAMLAVLFSLFSALFQLTKGGPGSSQRSLKFLIWRVGLCIALVLGLYLASFFGLIAPHSLLPSPQPSAANSVAH